MIRYLSRGLRGLDVKVVQDALNYRRQPESKEEGCVRTLIVFSYQHPHWPTE